MEWKTAKLSNGTNQAYYDVPAKKPGGYTLLTIHGIGFNAASFKPLVQHLPDDVRFIAYNQCGYKGSDALPQTGQTPGSLDVTEGLVLDLLRFMEFCINELGVRPVSESDKGSTGGFALLGWSKGTTQCLVLLYMIRWLLSPSSTSKPSLLQSDLSPSLTNLINSHLHSIILLEPPASSFGIPPRIDLLQSMGHLFTSPASYTAQDYASTFLTYFGARTSPDQPFNMEEDLPQDLVQEAYELDSVPDGFAFRISTDPKELKTLAQNGLSPNIWTRDEDSILDERLRRLPIAFMYGVRTIPYLLDVKDLVDSWWKEPGERKVAMVAIPNAGHFTFVDQPEECGKAIGRVLSSF